MRASVSGTRGTSVGGLMESCSLEEDAMAGRNLYNILLFRCKSTLGIGSYS